MDIVIEILVLFVTQLHVLVVVRVGYCNTCNTFHIEPGTGSTGSGTGSDGIFH